MFFFNNNCCCNRKPQCVRCQCQAKHECEERRENNCCRCCCNKPVQRPVRPQCCCKCCNHNHGNMIMPRDNDYDDMDY